MKIVGQIMAGIALIPPRSVDPLDTAFHIEGLWRKDKEIDVAGRLGGLTDIHELRSTIDPNSLHGEGQGTRELVGRPPYIVIYAKAHRR